MRYDARFRNGIWQVFDKVWFGTVGAFRSFKEAAAKADTLNKRPPKERRK